MKKILYLLFFVSTFSFSQNIPDLFRLRQQQINEKSTGFNPVNRPAFIGSTTQVAQSGGATISPSVPSGSNGEFLLLTLGTFSDDDINAPSGWTELVNRTVADDSGTGTGTIFAAYRFRDGTEGATVDVSATGNFGNSVVGTISNWSNVDQTLVFENQSNINMDTYDTTTGGTGVPLAGVSLATYNNSLAITIGQLGDTRNIIQSPSNYTSQAFYEGTALGGDAAIYCYFVSVDANESVSQDSIHFDQTDVGGSTSFILIGTE